MKRRLDGYDIEPILVGMDAQGIIQTNRSGRDLFFADDRDNVYFVVAGWYDYFLENGCGEEDEVHCYAPTHTRPNSPVETLYVELDTLAAMRAVSEEEARRLHPALFEHLAAIDQGAA